jgi:lipoprotein-releasing system permease protein
MLVTVSVVIGFKRSIQSKLTSFAAPIQINSEFVGEAYENKPFEDKVETRQAVLAHPFVEHVQPFGLASAILRHDEDFEGVVLKGVDSSYHVDYFKPNLIKGRFVGFDSTAKYPELVVSAYLANRLGIDTGNKVSLWFVSNPPMVKAVRVVGIYQTDIEEIDYHYVIGQLEMVRQVGGWSSRQIGAYEILLRNMVLDKLREQNAEIRYAIEAGLNSTSVLERYPQIFDWLGLLDKNVQIILVLMSVVAMINMITALLIIILERTQLIGTLMAMGYAPARLKQVFVWTAGFFVLRGLAIGNVLGLALLWAQYQFKFLGLSSDYYMTHVPVSFPWLAFTAINLITYLVCHLAMYIPASMVLRVSPIKSLRFT